MNKEEKIKYLKRLYTLQEWLLEKGIRQPIKVMIDEGIWTQSKNDHNYLSGRIVSESFLDSLEQLKNKIDV